MFRALDPGLNPGASRAGGEVPRALTQRKHQPVQARILFSLSLANFIVGAALKSGVYRLSIRHFFGPKTSSTTL